jgi:hypothetical protein
MISLPLGFGKKFVYARHDPAVTAHGTMNVDVTTPDRLQRSLNVSH